MPWQQNDGGGNNQNPWGARPGGGRNNAPRGGNEFEDFLKNLNDKFGQMPGGSKWNGFALIGTGALLLWLGSGMFIVDAGEQGIIQRFGAYSRWAGPGLAWHLPWPIETVTKVAVMRENSVKIGGGSGSGDSLMLTGDENILDVKFTVFYQISDPEKYLFDVRHNLDGKASASQSELVVAVAESVMREIVGRTTLERAQTENREPIEREAATMMQRVLDSYRAGIRVSQVKVNEVEPPAQVMEAYKDVQSAEADRDKSKQEAERYANQVVPEARGRAAKMLQAAEAYKSKVVAEANGDVARFNSVYQQYQGSKDVTRRRIYLETMEEVLGRMDKVIVGTKGSPVIQVTRPSDKQDGAIVVTPQPEVKP